MGGCEGRLSLEAAQERWLLLEVPGKMHLGSPAWFPCMRYVNAGSVVTPLPALLPSWIRWLCLGSSVPPVQTQQQQQRLRGTYFG